MGQSSRRILKTVRPVVWEGARTHLPVPDPIVSNLNTQDLLLLPSYRATGFIPWASLGRGIPLGLFGQHALTPPQSKELVQNPYTQHSKPQFLTTSVAASRAGFIRGIYNTL